MTNTWLRNSLVLVLAGVMLAGCAGAGSKRQPTEPSAEPIDTTDTTRAPSSSGTQSSMFDANMNPYVPGSSNRLLPRTYYFDYDRSLLKQEDLASLEMHATVLRSNPDRSVVIEGHADERGTREYNLALGERRSDAIRTFLMSAGVSQRQIEMVSYGEERPEDPGHDEAAWSRNRRAILIYR
jgi:peptidoglycan-associated lipoprotein